MAERRIPASLIWLAALVALTIAVAIIAGGIIYWETRTATKTGADAIARGNGKAGRQAFQRYGCGACHTIPGVDGPAGQVGPELKDMADRAAIAGRLPNEPDAMIHWLMHPQAISPGSGMPEMGVTERDARDMAAYLYAN